MKRTRPKRITNSEGVIGVRVGQVLHETYRVTALVAAGGMGIVFEAEHVRLSQKKFAIKVLHPSVMEDPAAYVRFRREAEIVSGLGHPHIVYVSDFNELDNGQPYLVMELLEGEDLKKRLRGRGPLTTAQVSEVMEQTAAALQVAHDKGIVHRDLKPGNIFLAKTPGDGIHVKLLDFGISKIRHSKSGVTEDLTLLGTPFYMAPEQAEGEISDIDHRTDIFALGTIAYLALSGKLPFEAASTPGVLFKVCYQEPKPITEHLPGISDEVHQVLTRALSKSKTDRYQRAEEFASDLKAALAVVAPAPAGRSSAPSATIPDMKPPSLARILAHDKEHSTEMSPPPRPLAPKDAPSQAPEESGEVSGEVSKAESTGGPLEAMDTSQDSLLESLVSPEVDQPSEEHSAEEQFALLPPDTAEVSLSDVEEVEPATDQVSIAAILEEDSISPSTLSAAVGERTGVGTVDPKPRRRFPLLLAGGAGLTLAASAVIVLLVLVSGQDEPRAPGPATGTPVAANSGVAAKPAPSTITVKLQVAPAAARISLDGEHRVDNPLILMPSPRERVLRVEATGHEPLEHTFVAQSDDTIVVTLNKQAVKPAAPAPRAKSAVKHRPAVKPAARPGLAPGRAARKVARPPAGRKKPPKKTKQPVWIYDDL